MRHAKLPNFSTRVLIGNFAKDNVASCHSVGPKELSRVFSMAAKRSSYGEMGK